MKDMNGTGCGDVCTFSMGEKLVLRGTFYGGIAVGAYAMWLASPALALAYVLFAGVGYFLLMRYTVCARCPHLFVAGDCVFVPAPLVKLFVAPRRGPLKGWERTILRVAALGTAVIPLFWLAGTPQLLILYLALVGGCIGAMIGHVCRKCRVRVCPLNKVFAR